MTIGSIEIDPRVCGGKPVIPGTRIPVTVIVDQVAQGATFADVLKKYPELTEHHIADALRYCHRVIEHTELEPAAS